MYLVTSEQMRCFDHFAIETHKIPGIVLMDHAGRAVAQAAVLQSPHQVLVLCGKGNNGGDGWVAARWLHHFGFHVHVLSVAEPEVHLAGDAKLAFEAAAATGVDWSVWSGSEGALAKADVIIDALLGTGCTRPLSGSYEAAARAVNLSTAYVIAVDVPTGVDASTGEMRGIAVRADKTLAMQYQKLGTAVTPGALCAGEVVVEDIGIRSPLPAGLARFVQPADFSQVWGQREAISHKGTYGRLGVFMGQMRGAAFLSARGATRSGAGLIVMAGMKASEIALSAFVPDYVVRDEKRLSEAFIDCQAVVIGPGLGEDVKVVREDLTEGSGLSQLRGVMDADGLWLLQDGDGIMQIGEDWVLTPHPKECARLLGWSVADVQARRVEAATTLATATGAVVLLKGYRTVIARSGGGIRVNPTGNAALAVGGSGDVLSGVIGSLMAQGLDAWTAASIGAWLHGRSGEHAGANLTPISTTASDIAEYLPKAVSDFVNTGSL